MKILLIDADSTIPNIPLMKLSTHYKKKGYFVELLKLDIPYYPNRKKKEKIIPNGYDLYFCSVIFDGSKGFINCNGNNVAFGGTGHNLTTILPEEIEQEECDYSLYPENEFSYGFITRGCIRNCYFCKVPQKEGGIHKVNDVDKIVRHKKVKFLDNNVLSYDKHLNVLQELADKEINCQFNQGLDIRLLNEENSNILSKINYLGEYIFAFDDIKYRKLIEEKRKLLSWMKDWRSKYFIYIHPRMHLKETIDRINLCREWKVLPYIMRDISCYECENSEFFTDLSAWGNQPNLFKYMSFEEFCEKRNLKENRRITSYLKWNANGGK